MLSSLRLHITKPVKLCPFLSWQFIELCILLGCDYLEPIKGVGPKSALKLMKEHGSLGKVVENLRVKMEQKAQAAEKKQKRVVEEEDVESEDEADPPAPSSDVEPGFGGAGSDDDEDREGEEDAEAAAAAAEERRKAKEAAKEKKKKAAATAARRGTGGVHVPDNWMWEEAKKLFQKPDVTPASEIEVSFVVSLYCFVINCTRARGSNVLGCIIVPCVVCSVLAFDWLDGGRPDVSAGEEGVLMLIGPIGNSFFFHYTCGGLVYMRSSGRWGRYQQLVWEAPDVEGLVEFLVRDKGFK